MLALPSAQGQQLQREVHLARQVWEQVQRGRGHVLREREVQQAQPVSRPRARVAPVLVWKLEPADVLLLASRVPGPQLRALLRLPECRAVRDVLSLQPQR